MTAAPTPKRRTLVERDKDVIWHPFSHASLEGPPVAVARAEGSWLISEEGKYYLDAISSWWVNTHGHCEPRIADAIAKQAHSLEHCIFAGFTHEPAVKLAELVLSLTPQNQERLFFSDNGSTAIEVALKMAIQWAEFRGEKRNRIVSLRSSYHGDTFGAMAVSERDTFTAPFQDYLFEVAQLDTPSETNIDQVASHFEELCASGDTLTFLFEPLVQGAGGMVMYRPEELDVLLGIAKKHSVLTIADEVMTGFGRLGTHFATLQTKNSPDMICMSKGITGGFLPLGATSCSAEVFEAFDVNDRKKFFFHGHSYTGNPLACAAGIASTEILLTEECQKRITTICEKNSVAAKSFAETQGLTNPRYRGTVLAVEIDCPDETHYLNPLRDQLYQFFLEKGVLMRPLGNVVYVLPPYCITDEELDSCYSAITEAADKFGKR